MKRDFPLRGASRRDFIKGVFAASAALGLGPTRALEMLDEIGGSALAAGAINANRTVHIVGGDGGFAWFTLVWPVPGTITELQTNSTVPFDDMSKAGKITSGALEDRMLYQRKVSSTGQPLWANYGEKKLVTAMLCGTNTGHETAPKNAGNSNTIPTGTIGAFAACASIQTTVQSLVPVIGLNRNAVMMPYGNATGAPSPAGVPDANAMINLFSSSASKLMTRLADPNNAKLYEEYYKAFLGLVKTVDRATYQRAYEDSRVAISLVSQNLGSVLSPAPGQVDAWCGPAVIDAKVKEIATNLIVAANAFKKGLCSQVTFPSFNDDPHFVWSDLTRVSRIADGLALVFQSFMDYMNTIPDPVDQSKKLSDNLVMTVCGDLAKGPFSNRNSDWADATPMASNWMYVMSNGYMKPGWFGQVSRTGKMNYDPDTGKLYTPAMFPDTKVTDGALGAMLYAVSRGNDRRVRDFTTASYRAMSNVVL